MKKIIFTVLVICIAHLSFSQTVTIKVDALTGKTPISPNIFGANISLSVDPSSPTTAATWQFYRDAGVKMFRENGGNNATKYNWRLKMSSHPDWYNNVYKQDWDYVAKSIQDNIPYANSMWAFQLIGKAASNTNNNFDDWDYNQSQWWSGVGQNLAGGGTPDPNGGSKAKIEGNPNLYLENWTADSTVGILDKWFGTGGLNYNKQVLKYWNMDNEPEIWEGTHDDVMPTQISAEAFMQNYFKVAIAARNKFPGIKLVGPVPANEWQWYNWSGNNGPNGMCWLEYFIKRIAQKEDSTGVRLLDVLDIHFYPSASTSNDIIQLHRVFFDRNYVFPEANGVKHVNGGWDNSINKEYIFARCNDWLTKYMGANHGVTLSVSETGFNGSNPNVTSVCYGSMLGTFADNGVEIFTPWSWNIGMWETLHLFSRYSKPYRVQSTSTLEDSVSAYSSINANADSMTIFLVNRSIKNQQNISVIVRNFRINGTYNTLSLYNLPSNETFVSHTNNALKAGTVSASDSVFTATLPPLSITAVTLSSSSSVPVTGVTVSPTTLTVGIGATSQLTSTVAPSNATNQSVTWSSSNTSVATVSSSGLVTGVAAGSATITVTTVDGAKTATSAITVANIPVTGVSVSPTTASISIGGTQQLTAAVLPTNAANKSITWASSNTSVATVSSSGLVTGVAAGSATITVTTVDGAFTATSVITVSNIPVTGVTVSPTTASISINGPQQLTVVVSPTNATNKNVTWASSNTAVATVSSTGLITGVAGGTATITVATVDGSFTATCAVTVSSCNLLSLFGAPLSTPLSSINTNYKYVYILGSHAAITNITTFTINWDLSNNGLYQFSINTNNGVPNWYVDLRSNMAYSFNTSAPSLTITGSGAGLDGDYYVANDNGNFVMIDKSAAYAIYFSNSTTAPQDCGNATIPVTGVSVSPTTASINVGATQQLTATVAPSNATNKGVSWSSSNTSVATVSSTGLVTGVATGTATITVTTADGGFTATSAITVTTSNIPVTGVSVSPTTASINVGATQQLTATVAPSNATNKNVSWGSSSTSVATVSSTGLVTGVAAGTATITVTTADGGFTATSAITVTTSNVPVTGVSVSPTTASINVGATQQLTATVAPSNATNKNVSWGSSSTSVATVSSTGLVTGVAAGTATITVTTTDGGFTATSTVTVTGTCNGCGCTFGTPTATALPSVNKSYNYAYVLGTGGPNLGNVTNFTINWDLANNGLWQFSTNTNNGVPNWYSDLRIGASQDFASAQPSITLSGTGFTGLDGSYYATVYNGDFVLVSKSVGFTIYFSNSTTAPTCTNTKSAKVVTGVEVSDVNAFSMFPNPVDKGASISLNLKSQVNGASYCITDLSGKAILTGKLMSTVNSINLNGKLNSGVYFVKIMNGNEQYNQKLIVKE